MKLTKGFELLGTVIMLGASAIAGLLIYEDGIRQAWAGAAFYVVGGIVANMLCYWLAYALHALQNINLCISRINYRQAYGEEMPRD